MASFRKVREAFLSEEGELDETDPESCVRQFYRCRQLPVLRKALRHADQAWMEEFLEWGGLVAIFDALSALAKKRMHSVIDAIPQLECVECLKAVMNSPYGLEFMINSGSDKFVHKLVLELDSGNVLVKLHIFLLLSALCKHSEEGLKTTLQALDNYKQAKCQRHCYSLLVQELDTSDEVPQYQASILAFINYVVSSSENLDARVKLRSELNALAFSDIMAELRFSDTDCLSEQVRVYEQSQLRDQQELEMPGGVDITNHEHLFRAVFEKVFDTPQSTSFLHILQKMLQIDRDTPKGDTIWCTMEKVMDSALAMSGAQQAERVHASAVERLRKALEEEDLRKEEAQKVPTQETPPQAQEEPEDMDNALAPLPVVAAPPPPPPPLFNLGQRIVTAILSVFDKYRNHQPKKPMKKLNWEKVPDARAKSASSLWHGASKEAIEVKVRVREETLELLFSQRGKAATNSSASSKNKSVHLPNSKKALNVNIVLDTMKCSNEEIVEMIRNGDSSALTLNQACVLVDMMPDDSDMVFLKPFQDNPNQFPLLGKPERFMLSLGEVEAYPLRLQVMKSKLIFEDLADEYLPSLEVLRKSLDELMNCVALRELFYIILLIGNIINGGSMLGKAYGFKVTSLQRFSTTLANVSRPNVNILHYLVTVCEEDCPSLLSYSSALPTLQGASRLSVNGIEEELGEYRKEIEEFSLMARGQAEEVVLPTDLKEQIQDFLPIAQEKLDKVYAGLQRVKQRGSEAADYFCDDRDDFLEKVFLEVKEFGDEFKKTIKETKKERPIELVVPTTESVQSPKEVKIPTPDQLGPTAVKRATSIITAAGLDYTLKRGGGFDPIAEVSTIPTGFSSCSPNRSQPPSPAELDVVITGTEDHPEPYELNSVVSQPHSLGMTTTSQLQGVGVETSPLSLQPHSLGLSTSHPVFTPTFKVPTRPPRGAFRRMMSRDYPRQLSMEVYSSRFQEADTLYARQLSADPMGITGDNLSHVATILHKMAQAIQRDIEDDVCV